MPVKARGPLFMPHRYCVYLFRLIERQSPTQTLNFENPRWLTAVTLQIVQLPYLDEKVIQLWWHCVHDCTFGTRWQPHNQIWIFLKFKMTDGRHFKNYCWPWLSNRFPDFSEILCEEAAFFTEFWKWNRYQPSTGCFFRFPNAVCALASGGFCIVSDTLVYS